MEFTKEQLELIFSESLQIDFELNNEEVLALYSLGQMHNKVVRMTDNFFENTKVGLFVIDELNGKTDLDFSNPDDWKEIIVQSISFSLISPNEWGGEDKSSFQDPLMIKSIALLK